MAQSIYVVAPAHLSLTAEPRLRHWPELTMRPQPPHPGKIINKTNKTKRPWCAHLVGAKVGRHVVPQLRRRLQHRLDQLHHTRREAALSDRRAALRITARRDALQHVCPGLAGAMICILRRIQLTAASEKLPAKHVAGTMRCVMTSLTRTGRKTSGAEETLEPCIHAAVGTSMAAINCA